MLTAPEAVVSPPSQRPTAYGDTAKAAAGGSSTAAAARTRSPGRS
ncbi:hypothetical protein I552_0451 [Mycobacterium xenopi 3993]|nr:hypothetical protein I552_0451 [Mycobacterium xenopi 3993]